MKNILTVEKTFYRYMFIERVYIDIHRSERDLEILHRAAFSHSSNLLWSRSSDQIKSDRVGSDQFGSGFGSCCERSIDNMFLEVFGVGVEAMCKMFYKTDRNEGIRHGRFFVERAETKGASIGSVWLQI